MPQVWLTYDELAGMLDCSLEQARERACIEQLDRKISRDGQKRAKLNTELTGIFIERLKEIDDATDRSVADLRHAHRLLSDRADGRNLKRFWLRVRRLG